MAEKLVTPLGELNWVFINGNTKKDLNDNDRYVASLYLHKDSDEFKEVEKKITTFWNENKPKGAKLKSNGIKVVQEKAEGPDDEYIDTDMMSINFWTGPTFPDGKEKYIRIFNARGSEVSLGSKKIGNGSIGAISGAMAIYDNGPAARGVTLYLNSIQLKKFVEYEGGDTGFSDLGDEDEDNFTGVESDFEKVNATKDEGAAKPRL